MSYRWIEHTAELALEVDADDEEQVFRDALTAFAELYDGRGNEPARHVIELSGVDREDLLARWLEELVFLADTQSFVPGRVAELDLRENALHAVVAGHVGAPRPIVKAVTYHGLEFRRERGRWRAHVVLDV